MRLLLVEDDPLLGDGVKTALLQQGYTVDWAKDGLTAAQALRLEKFDLVILDLGLPKMSGLEVLAQLRSQGLDTPVLLLTARETIEDRVKGLDTGADDYLTKPFDLDELFARLRALQRRFLHRSDTKIIYGNIVLDPATHRVTLNDDELNLPRREFALLQKLLENAGAVISREHLTQTLYGWQEDIDSNTLEVYICNLRKKLPGTLIRTIRGVGYMLESPDADRNSPGGL